MTHIIILLYIYNFPRVYILGGGLWLLNATKDKFASDINISRAVTAIIILLDIYNINLITIRFINLFVVTYKIEVIFGDGLISESSGAVQNLKKR